MEQEKKGGKFGIVLVIIIILGIALYYFKNKEEVPTNNTGQEASQTMEESQSMAQEENNSVESSTSLETEVENLDTNFEDMNSEDLDV